MKAMILAAGLGTRMRPLTDKTPKPLLKVGDEPLIVHHLVRLQAAGFSDIIINVSHLGEQIKNALGSGGKYGVNIVYSHEEEPLESGGGVVKALPLLGADPFLLVNGDIWCDFGFENFFLPESFLSRVLLVENPEQHPSGDFYLDVDKPIQNQGDLFKVYSSGPARYTYTFSGVSILSPDMFEHQEPGKFSLVPLLREQMNQGCVCGHLHTGTWVDVGTPERLKSLNSKLLKS